MKNRLKEIYLDLADGKINRREALEKIKAMKLGESVTLLSAPAWMARDLPAQAVTSDPEFSERYIVLCNLDGINIQEVESQIPGSRCVFFPSRPEKNLAERFLEIAEVCFDLIRNALQRRATGNVLIQIVAPASYEGLLYTGLSGLLKTASLEAPRVVGQLILSSPAISAAELVARLEAGQRNYPDRIIKYDKDTRFVREVQEIQPAGGKANVAFKDRGVYLITGGLGGLGLLFAEEIVKQTSNARIILAGRSGLTPEKEAVLRKLSSAQNYCEYKQLDISDLSNVTGLINLIKSTHGGLNGILHCAGIHLDNFMLKKSREEFNRVLLPKVTGTFNLDEATRDIDLDFMVLFSSVASWLGNAGQADYAAANGFMDQFAVYRNKLVETGKRNGKTLSIAWPLWQEGGMSMDPATRERLGEITGLRPLPTAAGLAGFYRSLESGQGQVMITHGDQGQMRRTLLAGGNHQLLPAAKQPASGLNNLSEQAQDFIGKQLALVLKIPAHQLDPQMPLEKYGIDSVLSMGLTNQLEKTFGSLPKTLFFEYQTIEELTAYFVKSYPGNMEALFSAPGPEVERPPVRTPVKMPVQQVAGSRFITEKPAGDDIAIIGLSGRYPEAVDISAYWQNLRAGKDCIIEVPADRWDWRQYHTDDRNKAGHHYSKWGGFISGVDEFDPRFFNISPKEAVVIDPQERLFLQHAWMAVEDAGYTRSGLQIADEQELAGQVGVYAGVMYGEYQLFSARENSTALINSYASIANRVSYVLNLHGPSMTLDTMCSSSLTAIHIACQDLKLGRTSMAIAGGVNVSIHPNKYLFLSAQQFISGDGHCQSFGEGGDGYIPGEGVGVVVLKRLSEAVKDKDHIYGVIKGSALNHGGRTNGYSVPNPRAQTAAVKRALSEAGMSARHISYIEAHGTGTRLGDPIEIAALSKAFDDYTQDKGYCLLGSAKSNIGHCESAAGIAGLTKVLLQMKHGQIVPSLHSAKLNPHIDFPKTPFIVNQTLRPWDRPVIAAELVPRIAGVSSFGAGGSNAHLIVQEYLPDAARARPVVLPGPEQQHAIPLSARSETQLKEKAADLLAFIQTSQDDLEAIAYTLQVGREAMETRLAFIVSSKEQLAGKLDAYCNDRESADLYQGQVRHNAEVLSAFRTDAGLRETIVKWIDQKDLHKILDIWVKGLDIDWEKLYDNAQPGRVSLPTYPFARERYWVAAGNTARPASSASVTAAAAAIHPLLHTNTSDAKLLRYSSVFSGREFFFTGDQPGGEKMLLEAAYLEMARVAMEKAMPAEAGSSILELSNVQLGQAFIFGSDKKLTIALYAVEDGRAAFEIYSNDNNEEVVHCQGQAGFFPETGGETRLDIDELRRQEGHSAEFSVPDQAAGGVNDYVLHPVLMEDILRAAINSFSREASVPFAFESLRLVSRLPWQVIAAFRYAEEPVAGDNTNLSLDIDLCDRQGAVCLQLRGIRYRQMGAAVSKPSITLQDTSLGLSGTDSEIKAPASLKLHEHGNGVYAIEVRADACNTLSGDLIADLLNCLTLLRENSSVKSLIIGGSSDYFLTGGQVQNNEALRRGLYEAIVSFPCPVIAAMEGDATGPGFLAGVLCDFTICSSEGTYSYTAPQDGIFPTAEAYRLFEERFGAARARDFLYLSRAHTGASLKEKGWTMPVLSRGEVNAYARKLGMNLAEKPAAALRLLKRHLARPFAGLVKELKPAAPLTKDCPAPQAGPGISSSDEHLRLEVLQDNILKVSMLNVGGERVTNSVLSALAAVFERVATAPQYKCIVLASEYANFLPDGGQGLSGSEIAEFQELFLGSGLPVIAVLDSGASGLAWFLSQFCDACLYDEGGSYSLAANWPESHFTGQADAIFAYRLGPLLAKELVLTGDEYTGLELQGRCRTLALAPKGELMSGALQLARDWARLPLDTIQSWKKQSAAAIRQLLETVPAARAGREEPAGEFVPLPAGVTEVALESPVISAKVYPEGVLVVKMEDRQAKNMFSDAFTRGMTEVFAHIEQTSHYKVVILTGFDNYFASGGTRDTLLAIQEGKIRFTDTKIYQLAMNCSLPVIAAMQGHGIGAGWALGMFADFILLSEESTYVSPYMEYGFTPGAGATFVFPQKAGYDLARETLFTAMPVTGRALKARHIGIPVLRRDRVYETAFELARKLARHSRNVLTALKHQWTYLLEKPLEESYRLELEMHEKTFVGQSLTEYNIKNNFSIVEAVQSGGADTPAPPRPGPDKEALAGLTAGLRQLLAEELHLQEHEIDDDTQFIDLGLDSITGVTWIRRINEKYKTSIEATKIYSYPTLARLSRFVKTEADRLQVNDHLAGEKISANGASGPDVSGRKVLRQALSDISESARHEPVKPPGMVPRAFRARLTPRREAPAASPYPLGPPPSTAALATYPAANPAGPDPQAVPAEPIAIIGMAGQFPMAADLDEFWRNIAQAKNCIREIPRERWDIQKYYQESEAGPGKTNSKWSGMLESYDLFDPLFFNLSPLEAERMDPQQRVLLQACWHSIENAGYNPKTLSGSNCGVYIGCASGDYQLLSRELQISAQGFTGGATSILAARISYLLNLQGPCLSIDTACSSSLVAIATACDNLISGNCDTALAGGVYVMVGPDMHIKSAQSGMLSREGKCYSFDQRANGFVPGEGVGVIMLKRLSRAEKDGDIIHGLIHGWAVNQDGKTNGITAPSEESQTRLEQGLYDKFRIDPSGIQLVEAHGTGTKLGDPIEVSALKESFKKYTAKKGYCALGSVKSNIGHCLTAAGAASFIKTILALKHRQLPPTINFNSLNEHISLEDSPFYVNDRLREWEVDAKGARMAAVSGFGFSGTNAHIVVGEYVNRAKAKIAGPVSVITQNEAIIVPLSARTADRLTQKVIDLLTFVREQERSLDLLELAYTLQAGREAMGARLVFLVSSVTELAEKLRAYIDKTGNIKNMFQGQVKENREALSIINTDPDLKETVIENWIGRRQLSKLAGLWVRGMELDWKLLYGERKPQRIVLPGYPFAKERYWIREAGFTKDLNTAAVSPALHPLLHKNVSDIQQQRYSTVFSGEELFLEADPGSGGKKLPALLQLEMAREALIQATPAPYRTAVVELRNVVWDQPVVIRDGQEVSIVLTGNGDDDRLAFEVFSGEGDQECVHCRGEVFFSDNVVAFGNEIAAIPAGGKAAVQGWDPGFCLRPDALNAALRACATLAQGRAETPAVRPLPAAVGSVTIVSDCPGELQARASYAQGNGAGNELAAFDVDLCDEQGRVWVEINGLQLALQPPAETSWDKVSYVCQWAAQPAAEPAGPAEKTAAGQQSVLIVCSGSCNGFENVIAEFYRKQGDCRITLVHNSDNWQTALRNVAGIDAFYFLAMNTGQAGVPTFQDLSDDQEKNEIQLLRILKYLSSNNKISNKADTYILTLDNHAENGSASHCFGAGVAGLAYSLAQAKYQFHVRNLDLSSDDLIDRQKQHDLFQTIYKEPFSSRGDVIKIRSGRRYRQEFVKLHRGGSGLPAIKQNGVYFIAGGSGTVGRIITRKLIQKYNAQVIWTGRSAPDSEKVRSALSSCEEFSEKVHYIQTDVRNEASMKKAVESAKDQFGPINGAIFAGMVFVFENSIDETTEDEFRAILDVKTHGSWVFYNAFKAESPDFMCFFSSAQAYSFSGASRLSAYASAMTFSDRLVQSFYQQASFPVGIINWGFWKSSVDIIAGRDNDVITENLNALDDQEGFTCFETFVNDLNKGRINQLMCMKMSDQVKSLVNLHPDEYVSLANEQTVSPALPVEIPLAKIEKLKQAHENDQLENWLARLLYSRIIHLARPAGRPLPVSIADLQKQAGVLDKYTKWFQESLYMLAATNYIDIDGDIVSNWKEIDTKALPAQWDLQKDQYRRNADTRSLVALLDDCLQKLPEVLRGTELATDVIFPNSTMKKVEGVYKNNKTADVFNEIIADNVVAYLKHKLRFNPAARLRILEIGAGTGGTSAVVFEKLRPYKESIEKYCYTDLSKAFFFHAGKNYISENPYLQCQRLDIESPVADQGIETGSYDLVIATNVLHATKNIRRVIRNAKAALYKDGFIMLNELCEKSLATHLTFGLLDGWWLFEDADLRIPNCPGLYPSAWKRVLEEEGFKSVTFPAEDAHELGQQVILAQSDGVIRHLSAQVPTAGPAKKTAPNSLPLTQAKKSLPLAQAKRNVTDFIGATIMECLTGTLRISPDEIEPEIAFSDYGVDSILGANFINEINSRLALSLNTAVIFEYASLNALSKHIVTAYGEQVHVSGPQVRLSRPRLPVTPRNRTVQGERFRATGKKIPEIAVVGMSGMMPQAGNLREFWNNVINGVDGVDELPEHYLDHDKYYSTVKQAGKTRCKWGGIVEDRDCFDPLFFNLSPWEAESMSPHQRLILQEGWKAIEDAGYGPRSLSGSKTGVFVGVEPTGYYGETFTGYSDAIIPSRLSYLLNLKGPALAINTGCSSSGVALHLACESLRNKETDMALAGGVNACMDHHVQIRLDEIDMLSPDGRCNTFDAAGSGTIISEGVGVIVLKRLEDAIASNDTIYGVICGSGTNQDGASNGITAPNGAAQEELIVDVYNKFGIDPADISYVEAHGTGTKLGDPVEAGALVRAFKRFTAERAYCSVGSAKSHVGHTGAAAAVTGLMKVLLSLKHQRIPGLLHFNTINPLIDFSESPFYINRQAAEWKPAGKRPRMAAINSFGHSGTNVHLVVKDYLPENKPVPAIKEPAPDGEVIIPLSAKTSEQLRQKAADLLAFIDEGEPADLFSIAYTLQTGRDAMEHRLGFITSSVRQLAGDLRSYLNGEAAAGTYRQGRANRSNDDISKMTANLIKEKSYLKLLELWVSGAEPNWASLYSGGKPQHIGLPTYPFARERYWYKKTKTVNDQASLEEIIDKIDDDSIATDQAVDLLTTLVQSPHF